MKSLLLFFLPWDKPPTSKHHEYQAITRQGSEGAVFHGYLRAVEVSGNVTGETVFNETRANETLLKVLSIP